MDTAFWAPHSKLERTKEANISVSEMRAEVVHHLRQINRPRLHDVLPITHQINWKIAVQASILQWCFMTLNLWPYSYHDAQIEEPLQCSPEHLCWLSVNLSASHFFVQTLRRLWSISTRKSKDARTLTFSKCPWFLGDHPMATIYVFHLKPWKETTNGGKYIIRNVMAFDASDEQSRPVVPHLFRISVRKITHVV